MYVAFLSLAVIHGDFNEQNIIVAERAQEKQTTTDKFSVQSVIDFGDSHEAYYVMDVAIGIAYFMIGNNLTASSVELGGHFLVGYQRHMVLTDAEFDALHILVAGRLCQSLVLGAYSHANDPQNDYLLTTAKLGWPLLEKVWGLKKEDIYSVWRNVITSH